MKSIAMIAWFSLLMTSNLHANSMGAVGAKGAMRDLNPEMERPLSEEAERDDEFKETQEDPKEEAPQVLPEEEMSEENLANFEDEDDEEDDENFSNEDNLGMGRSESGEENPGEERVRPVFPHESGKAMRPD